MLVNIVFIIENKTNHLLMIIIIINVCIYIYIYILGVYVENL